MSLEKVYRAAHVEDALAKIKRDLGADALITTTRRLPSIGGKRGLVELRAIPPSVELSPSTQPTDRPVVSSPGRSSTKGGVHNGMTSGRGDSFVSLARRIERRLCGEEFPENSAKRIGELVGGMCPESEPRSLIVRNALDAVLREEFRFDAQSQQRRISMFVGPAGVGKTTALIKLAAHASLLDRKRIGLITTDQFRLGAQEELMGYADFIDAPCVTAYDGPSLRKAIDGFSKLDAIYIDTGGCGVDHDFALRATRGCLKELREPVATYFCLAASTRQHEMQMYSDRYGAQDADFLIITKLDEAAVYGSIASAQIATELPFAYFTTGRRVPDDIEVASAERLGSLVWSEEIG